MIKMPSLSAPLSLERVRTQTFDAIIDVRAPSEFALDHLPGAINLPVLNDDERAQVGTLYKQVSPLAARQVGAGLVAANIARHLATELAGKPATWAPLVYCWRGGQRSRAMAQILSEIGYRVERLEGGYKSWRAHVLSKLDDLPTRLDWRVIDGPTGVGKTDLLAALGRAGAQVLDIEALAAHRGSIWGVMPGARPTPRKLFDSKLVAALEGFDRSRPVWVEAESPRLGDVHLPSALYAAMIAAPRITLDLDRAARAAAIIRDYAPWLYDPERIVEQLQRLAPLHPRARIEEWQNWARARDFRALIDGLLDHHYDPLYKKTRYTRPPIRHVVIKETTPSAIDQLAASLLSDDKIKKVLGPDPRTHR